MKFTKTTENRSMVDIHDKSKAYNQRETENVEWINLTRNLADISSKQPSYQD